MNDEINMSSATHPSLMSSRWWHGCNMMLISIRKRIEERWKKISCPSLVLEKSIIKGYCYPVRTSGWTIL